MVNNPNKTYSITEAANLCGINRITLWRWIKSGKLKGHQTPTKHFRIKQEDLETFIQEDLTFLDLEFRKNNETILIIDDEEDIRKFVRRALSRNSWKIEEAKNGFEAGLKILKFKPWLIILDLYMPEMNGFEICKLLKGDPHTSNIKILAVTGFGIPEIREKILKLGADAYLEKPLERQTLLQCVEGLFK